MNHPIYSFGTPFTCPCACPLMRSPHRPRGPSSTRPPRTHTTLTPQVPQRHGLRHRRLPCGRVRHRHVDRQECAEVCPLHWRPRPCGRTKQIGVMLSDWKIIFATLSRVPFLLSPPEKGSLEDHLSKSKHRRFVHYSCVSYTENYNIPIVFFSFRKGN